MAIAIVIGANKEGRGVSAITDTPRPSCSILQKTTNLITAQALKQSISVFPEQQIRILHSKSLPV